MSQFRRPPLPESPWALACTVGVALLAVAAGAAAYQHNRARRTALALTGKPEVRPARFDVGQAVMFQPQQRGGLWTGPWVRGHVVAARLYSEPRDRQRLRYRYDIRSTEQKDGEELFGYAVEEYDISPARA